jgi:membrane-bound lytic murein transglycosylase MltF
MKQRKLLAAYSLSLLAAVGTMSYIYICSRPQQARDYEAIREEGVLRILTEYNPLGYYVSGDTIKGFQYELCRAIAGISGLDVQIQLATNLAGAFEALQNGKCDVIAQNIPVTSSLKETCLFTDPVMLSKQVLVQRTAASNNGIEPVRNHPELGKKTIYIPQSSPALLRIRHLEHEIGDTIFVVEDNAGSAGELIAKVAQGEIDYAVCDRQIAARLAEELPGIDIETDISFTQLQAWAVRPTSPVLRDSLNNWLAQIHRQGLFSQIYKRYYRRGN